jgi:uncharacterized protein with beta-barrel porin domain
VNGAIANSAVSVSGVLSGTGTVGSTTVNTGGTLSPGSSTPGTSLAVSGSLAFASGAMYVVQLNTTTANFAQVTGIATLAGSVKATFAAGSYLSKQYTILQSAGLGGTTFAGLTTTNLQPGFSATLSYKPTSVLLNLFGAMPTAGLATNQKNVAGALNNFFNGGGAMPPSFLTVFGLSGASLQSALTQLSGEAGTGPQQATFNAMTQFMGVLTDPFIDGRGDPVATAGGATGYADEHPPAWTGKPADALGAIYTKAAAPIFNPGWSVWSAGFGGSQTTDGNATLGSNSATSRIVGTAVGADYRLSPFTIAGFALTGGATSFSVANSGTGHSDLFQAGAFVKQTIGAHYVTAALAYGWQDVTTNRTVTVAGIDRLQSRFNANAFSGRVEGGYRFVSPWMGVGITPYEAAQFTSLMLPAYAENAISGANAFALNFGSKTVTDPRIELGVRGDKSYALTNAILTLCGRLAWAYDFNPDRAIATTFRRVLRRQRRGAGPKRRTDDRLRRK